MFMKRLEMIAENSIRAAAILIGLSVLGCAPITVPVGDTAEIQHPTLHPDCPYANVYVAVSTNGSDRDTKIAERIRLRYADFLEKQGFSIVDAPEQAYWSAFSMVRLSHRIDSTFAWTVYMMATQDLQGDIQTPRNFAGENAEESERSGFMLLRGVRLLELKLQTEQAAVSTESEGKWQRPF